MAMDMFIKIDGLAGEAVDKTHRGEIDVLSWQWGVTNPGSAHAGGGAGAGKANVQDLVFTKWIDKSSPDLWLAACNGKHWPQATLVVRKAGETPLEYLTISLSQVMVSGVNTRGVDEDDRLTETVSLNFASVKLDYVEQTARGGAGAKPSMHWNIAENARD